MIQKVSLYFILPMCIIALFLSLAGVQQITLGNDYYSFLSSVGNSFDAWKLEIPDIPNVPRINQSGFDSNGGILEVLVRIGNFFVGFINVIIYMLNIIINIVNIVIQVIQFIFTIIYQCKDFIGRFGEVRTVAYV